ncbi:sialoadhesin-like isoform X2 [Salvelinus alpinus]|uniref:sialoadhesin-like isoform X2 n=1 Tax=Salvelinus alpinus TaxID=8036 RepID=UPI0039FD3193
MAGALRFLLSGCLLQGVLCADWTALMPQSIKALKGSCVRIPCSFTLGSLKSVDYNPCLKTHSCNAIWTRGGTDKTNIVGSSPSGNLNQKDCTTILDNKPTGDTYYFRLECGNCVKFNFGTPVQINIADTPPTPTLTPATVEVRDGTSVSLICSAAAPCPSLPPTLTWSPSLGRSEEGLQENQDKTQVKTSSLTFTASYLRHEQKISCTALYKQQDGKNVKSPETTLTVTVLFSPKNTSVSVSPSGPVVEGSSMALTCSSNANPAVSYTWYRVNGVQVTTVGSSRMLTIQVSADNSQFYCEARNDHGSQNSSVIQLDLPYPPMYTSVLVSPSGPVVEGSSVTLTCSSNANPAVGSYTWYRVNGVQVTSIGDGEKHQTQVYTDQRKFYCEARNVHGTQNSSVFELDVMYSPKNTSVSVSPSGSVIEGSSVTLTCNSNANPAVKTYTWYTIRGGRGTPVKNMPELTVQVLTDNSMFYCEAKNDHGIQKSSAFQLDMMYPPKNTSVSVSPSDSVLEGSSVSLTCNSDANPAVSYTWYRVNGVQVTSIGHGDNHQTQVYTDHRQFYCGATNDHGSKNSSVIELDVLYPPKNTAVSVSPSGSVVEGSFVTLTCSSNANPAVKNYTWYRVNGGPGTQIANEKELKTEASIDNHQFYCQARNDHGTKNSSIILLNVIYPPKNTSVSVSPSSSAIEGSSVTLTCSSNANPPVGSYTWYRVNREQVTELGSSRMLTIKVPADNSQFYCETRNRLGYQNSSVTQLDGMYPPKNTSLSVSPSGSVVEGSSVTLTCSSNANPAVKTYTWYRVNGNEGVIVGSGQSFTFNKIAINDSGRYYCEAENKHGVDNSTTTNIDVTYPPKNSSVSVSPSSSVIEGSSVTLTCSSNANPPVGSYTWYRVNREQVTEVGSSRMLTIKVPADNSQFYCETRNRLGSQNSSVTQLDGMYPPKNTSLSVSPSGSVVEGSSVTLTCSSNANPAVKTYTWYRVNGNEGVIVGSGQSFTFNKIAINDSGRYYCEAENKHGVDNSTTTNIDVTFAPKILPSSRCIRTADQINCTCESHGNPSPKVEWRLAGHPVNHFTNTVIREPMGSTGLRSSLTTHQSQEEDTPTLVCLSTNSVGSSSLQFCTQCLGYHQGLGKSTEVLEGQVSLPIFITAIFVSALMTALICALLYLRRVRDPCFKVLRGHYKYYNSDVRMNLVPTSGERTQDPPAPEEDIYANSMIPSQARRQGRKQNLEAPNPGPKPLPSSKAISETDRTSLPSPIADTAIDPGEGTAKKEGDDVFYSSVIWKKKKWMKKNNEGSVDGAREASSGSYLEEERCVLGNVGRHRISKVLEMDHLQFL